MVAALTGCGRPPPPPSAFTCPPGVVARTRTEPLAFSAGWTRLVLTACPGPHGAVAALEVEGADHVLAYAPGRPGGVTAAILTGGVTTAPARAQTFETPVGSAQAREVVLAPWPFASASPRLQRISLLEVRSAPLP